MPLIILRSKNQKGYVMAEKVNLQQQIQQYRQSNPKLANLSDKQILSIMVENGKINLTEAQKKSIFTNNATTDDNMGLKLERTGINQEKNNLSSIRKKSCLLKTG